MKENPALIAAAAAHAGDPRGTPAGNAPLTQEQFAALDVYGLKLGHVQLMPVLIAKRPPCPGDVPAEHRIQGEMVLMPCPVMGEHLVAPGLSRPILLLPDGKQAIPLE